MLVLGERRELFEPARVKELTVDWAREQKRRRQEEREKQERDERAKREKWEADPATRVDRLEEQIAELRRKLAEQTAANGTVAVSRG
jgi:hypothetical protein